MEEMKVSHRMLVAGNDFFACEHRVRRFFARTDLVQYDHIEIVEKEAVRGDSPDFSEQLDLALEDNQQVLKHLIEELAGEGVRGFADLHTMEQGYASKIFHTVAHLLDGFFGIDSVFYNLEEDAHGVSADLRQKIEAEPVFFWLLVVRAQVGGGILAPIGQLRTFEPKKL